MKTAQIQQMMQSRKELDIYPTDADSSYLAGEDTLKQHVKKMVRESIMMPLAQCIFDHHGAGNGHPVLEAMNATGTCCRRCLYTFHKIPAYRELEEHEMDMIVERIFSWILESMSS